MKNKFNRRIFSVLFAVLFIISFVGCENPSTQTSVNNNMQVDLKDNIKIHFIDVGQADSMLIQQGDYNMLIDAGNNDDSDMVVEYLENQGVKKLQYVIGTHPHEDHIGGLDYVIKEFEIDKVIMPKKTSTTRTFNDVVKALKAKKLKATVPAPGDVYKLGDAKWTVLAPSKGKEYHETNNYSIVLRMEFKNKSFLFTGDAEKEIEEEIIEKGYEIKSDLLKLGHHGSSSSTSRAFFNKVNPKYAIISCGVDNKYNHPHKETMQTLQKSDAKVYRTDKSGTIICASDGKTISFNIDGVDNKANNTSKDNNATVLKGEVIIKNIDLSKEICTIVNKSKNDIDMTGWKLISVKGNQIYNFQDGFVLKANSEVNINSGSKAKDDGVNNLLWTEGNIWSNSGDPGELYNNLDELISTK